MSSPSTPSEHEALNLPIGSILVGPRRRQEQGDLGALAESLRLHGLIHPIVVDGDHRLIAGGRRLAAARSLGWTTIDVRVFASLSEDEQRAIELEENLRRKDLSARERTRTILEIVETARKIAAFTAATALTCADSAQVRAPHPGPARTGGSLRDVAERTGLPVATIRLAEQHQAALDRYPELNQRGMTQDGAITIAKNLDKLPEPERARKREGVRRSDPDTVTELAEKPPMPKLAPEPRSAGERWTTASYRVSVLLNSIRAAGGVAALTARWTPAQRAGFRAQLGHIREVVVAMERELEEVARGENPA